jgi:ribose 5-phosphate isomerase B
VTSKNDPIIIGSDHAGFALKTFIKGKLEKLGFNITDIGAQTLDPQDDYPVYASAVARAISNGAFSRGIAICGAGIGTSIVANRFPHVRAALCVTPEMARLSRAHNNSNILVLGERITPFDQASEILHIWLDTEFEGGRHERRVNKIEEAADCGSI